MSMTLTIDYKKKNRTIGILKRKVLGWYSLVLEGILTVTIV
jgi:hypothetical protein